MSYDVHLESAGNICMVPSHNEGGTYVMGGTNLAMLNITHNYSEVYRLFNFGITDLDGKKARDVEPLLQKLVTKLGVKKYGKDYWAPTPGNAGYALSILLQWAILYPEATFTVF
jgi:hypothetical protein